MDIAHNSSAQSPNAAPRPGLLLSQSEGRIRRLITTVGEVLLFAVASLSVFAVLFIFYFIVRDAVPFMQGGHIGQFFTSAQWYPTHSPEIFGGLSIFFGSLMVTIGACVVAVPLGVCSAVALSDIVPFGWRQTLKPVIELLASIPSVAYGFFALVVFAPVLQNHGSALLCAGAVLAGLPVACILSLIAGGLIAEKQAGSSRQLIVTVLLLIPVILFFQLVMMAFVGLVTASAVTLLLLLSLVVLQRLKHSRAVFTILSGIPLFVLLGLLINWLSGLPISSGTNALNVSVILGIMALPTIVSVSEDALQAVGPELRMGSYGLGATRAETLTLTVIPAASSGICAGIILGIMRALGETMVVWMASGNAASIPEPWYNFLAPVRTLTATIAGEMGETARGTQHYSVLFMTALCLLAFCFVCNLVSEHIMKRRRMKLRGEK